MGYVTYSRGFKSGGFDMRGNAAVYPQTENGYASETADSYEAGIKIDAARRHAVVQFHRVLRSVQERADPRAAIRRLPGCADQSHRGAQCRQADQPGRRTRIRMAADQAADARLNVGYLDSYYKDFLIPCNVFTAAPAADPASASSTSPTRIGRSTRRLDALGQRDLHLGSRLGLVARARRLRLAQLHEGRSHVREPDRSAGVRSAQRGLAYTTASKAWRFSIDGKNLTNKYYRVAGYDFGRGRSDPRIRSSAASARSATTARRARIRGRWPTISERAQRRIRRWTRERPA
jgi:iron complex outermembrane recepter protein